MRYPYERFLRYLVSRQVNVPGALERIGLPSVGDLWRSTALRELSADASSHIRQYLHAPRGWPVPREGFLDWASRHQIDRWWREQPELAEGKTDPALELAGRLFFSPATRAVVGMLLLASVDRDEVRKIVHERFRIDVDDAALGIYEDAYWDVRRTTVAFWKDVVPKLEPEERQLLSHGLRWPPPPLAELRYLLGLPNHDVDPDEALKETLALAQQGLREAAAAPVPEHQNIFKWAQLVERVAGQMRKGKKPELKEGEAAPDPAKAFNLFSITVDRTPIPTLAELEGELPERK